MIMERTRPQDLTAQLTEAKEVLQGLREELPRYENLLTDTQQREVELQRQFRAGTGKFSDLTEAKNATATARELLDQHQSDIASAQAEVSRLEAEIDRVRKQREWAAIKQEAEAIKAEWDEQVTELTRQYLEGLKGLEPLVKRRQKYFERMPVIARAAGITRDLDINNHLFNLDLGVLRHLEEFQPTHIGSGNYMFSVQPRLFKVTVDRGG